jgi:hypothetical protein
MTAFVALISPAWAAPVRVFAVGHKQRLEDVVSYAAFRAKMSALMDAVHPSRSSVVQAGVDDVASHLRPRDPGAPERALVVFPESVGLIAAFIGTRGDTARQQATATGAIVTLLGTYDAQRQYYNAKFPNQPLVRTLVLALTDTFYRSVYETFRDLAVQHGVHLAVSADLAPARRVDDPDLVALLRDPDEPARSYAYEAVDPRPHNTTFVFAPDGSVLVPDGRGGTRRAPAETDGVLSGSIDKAYLVPIEQPPPGEAAGLALVAGGVADVEVLDTPVGRLGVVISKDAWMPDVNDRLAMKGANVILQPEAFDSWAFTTTEWLPDVFKEGGFATLQKQPEFLLNVNASMTGNLIDITFDGQTAILGRRRKTSPGPLGPGNAFVGQNPDTGFLALAPWVVPDPGIAEPSLALGTRRSMLVETGMMLLPGSGVACPSSLAVGACENGYREAIVWTDVELPDGSMSAPVDPVREAPPSFGESVRVSGEETEPVAQHAPRIAARGKRVFVVWHEVRAGFENVYLAVSRNGGRSCGRWWRGSTSVTSGSRASASPTSTRPAPSASASRSRRAWASTPAGPSRSRPITTTSGRPPSSRATTTSRSPGPTSGATPGSSSSPAAPTAAPPSARTSASTTRPPTSSASMKDQPWPSVRTTSCTWRGRISASASPTRTSSTPATREPASRRTARSTIRGPTSSPTATRRRTSGIRRWRRPASGSSSPGRTTVSATATSSSPPAPTAAGASARTSASTTPATAPASSPGRRSRSPARDGGGAAWSSGKTIGTATPTSIWRAGTVADGAGSETIRPGLGERHE